MDAANRVQPNVAAVSLAEVDPQRRVREGSARSFNSDALTSRAAR